MALKVFDGFDHYNAAADFLTRSGWLQWQFPTATPSNFSFVTGLNGQGKALKFGPNQNISQPDQRIRAVLGDRNAEGYPAFRINIPLGTSLTVVLFDTVGNDAQVTINFNASNYSISAYRGTSAGTLLGISDNNVWAGATNQFVEIHYLIAGAGGSIEVRIREVAVLTITGANTKNTANAWADGVDFNPNFPGFGNPTATIDDFRYNDTTSDSGIFANNAYMGDSGVHSLFATGDGTVQWTPNSGSTNYSRVNEQAMDSDTSYNSTATAGDEDQLTFQPITNVVPIIYGVQITIAARKDDVGPRVIKTGLISGATTDYGANHSVPDTYAYFTDLWIFDPNTGANWTRSAVNSVIGVYNLVS